MPGIQQLSPLELGEDNPKLEAKKLRIFKSINVVVIKDCYRHAGCKSGLSFVLALLLHGQVLGKTWQSAFPEYAPLTAACSDYGKFVQYFWMAIKH